MMTLVPGLLIFDLPLPENLGNHRLHWAEKHRRRSAYFDQLDRRVTVKMLPRPPRTPWSKAQASVEVTTFRQMDTDNATARIKWCLDWLKTRGYIVDDSPAHLDLNVQEPITGPMKECGVVIRLTEVLG